MNKNNVIFILFVATMVGSTWGAVVNRQKIDLEQQLIQARAEVQRLGGLTGQGTGAPGEDEDARKRLAAKDAELTAARKELETLRRQMQDLQAELSRASVAMPGQREAAGTAADRGGEEKADCRALQQRFDEANAQLLGLEKIVEEKNAAMRDVAAEKERRQINMDVLLGKIVDLQSALAAVQEENRELVKQLAARNDSAGVRKEEHPGEK